MEKQEELLQALGATLASLVSMKEIAGAAQQHFSNLGIQRCYLSLYDIPESGFTNVPPQDLKARLVLQYQAGKAEWQPNSPEFQACQLLPTGLLSPQQRYTAIITQLGLPQNPLGILWNELGPGDWEVYIRLSNLLSSALFRTLLIRQREQAMQEIGQLLVRAEQHAIELAVAKEAAEDAARRTQQALQEADGLFRAALAILGATVVTDICQKLTSTLHPSGAG